MNVFLTGSSGYIGSAVALKLVSNGISVRGLTRDPAKGDALKRLGVEPVLGDLDDSDLLSREARRADSVINAANSDHRGAAETFVAALSGSDKLYIQSSGSSVVGDEARGEPSNRVYDETEILEPAPERAARVAIDRLVLDAPGLRSTVLCNSMVYGDARGLPGESVLIAALARQALSSGVARYVGRGLNRWSNVHLDDLTDLYLLLLRRQEAGNFLFVENGEEEMRVIAQAIADRFGLGAAVAATAEEAESSWGWGLANYALGSNSRVRGQHAKALGWRPKHGSIIDWITLPDSRPVVDLDAFPKEREVRS
jgi:nucleoside-diphosphate-sugar epimerase